jgi:hypothetical protein
LKIEVRCGDAADLGFEVSLTRICDVAVPVRGEDGFNIEKLVLEEVVGSALSAGEDGPRYEDAVTEEEASCHGAASFSPILFDVPPCRSSDDLSDGSRGDLKGAGEEGD